MAPKRKKSRSVARTASPDLASVLDEARQHINAKNHADALTLLGKHEAAGAENSEYLTLYARALAVAGEND